MSKRPTGWTEALLHALECEGRVNVHDLADAIPPGPAQRDAIDALSHAARGLILDGRARLDPIELHSGVAVLRVPEE
jgi:hypothetical protein